MICCDSTFWDLIIKILYVKEWCQQKILCVKMLCKMSSNINNVISILISDNINNDNYYNNLYGEPNCDELF